MPATKTKGYKLNAAQKLDQLIAECGPAFVLQHLAATMGWNARYSPVAVQKGVTEAVSHLTKACDILERIGRADEA